ncbi:terpenoid synthase [Aspergillus steynii IBT 23096]|uniref:Terpenoid synthase n=1 Tax=Aspergillus steynii IBT 23096 TaxID=1392250 RepID=A0A2I2GMB1_9EURO|nr:terpenoid synthase [Aspergillus steynii IBT 23096]PLB54031.1 terpenoid synthase [Aspergillus steynii IBT 23096]
MSVLQGFQFQYSSLPDPADQPPRYFNILPHRQSNLSDEHYQAGDSGLGGLVWLMNKSGTAALRPKRDHILKWGMPELSPKNVRLLAPLLDLVLSLHDVIDTLDDKGQEAIYDDLLLSILTFWKLGATPKLNQGRRDKLIELLLGPIINGRPDLKERFFKALLVAVSARSVQPDHGMTFEEFKKVQIKQAEAKTGFDLAMLFQGYPISEEEQASVSQLRQHGYLSAALSSDFYGFEKEYHRHAAADTVDRFHNSVAILMIRYGYNEDEAKAILKSEILDAERKLLDGYQEWEASSEPKSDNLRAYMGFFILAIGGCNYWQSYSLCDHVDEVEHSMGVRAQLIGKTDGNMLRLEGYAPPATVGINEHSSVDEKPCMCSASQNAQNQHPDERKEIESPNSTSTYDILAPFQKTVTEKNCTDPYTYTKSLPGKNTIGKFLHSLKPWFPVSDNSLLVITEIMNMLFTSSLMLDDIEDGSHLRRGLPAAHVKFGLSQTVNSATYLFGKAVALAGRHLRPECPAVTMNELEILTLGQGMDLNWTFLKKCPTVSEYLIMIDHKTGGFFRLALQLMQVDADVQPNDNLMHLITLMGRYYQIRDDYQNLASEEYTAKKGFCDDLSEGKFSFPLIHLLQQSPNADVLRQLPIFGADGQRDEVSEATKLDILDEMKRTGSLEHTLDVLNQLFDSMLATLDTVEKQMGPNKKLRCLILLLKL